MTAFVVAIHEITNVKYANIDIGTEEGEENNNDRIISEWARHMFYF